jgi:hypothetical protein
MCARVALRVPRASSNPAGARSLPLAPPGRLALFPVPVFRVPGLGCRSPSLPVCRWEFEARLV